MNQRMRRFLRDTAVLGLAALLVRFVSILANRFVSAKIGDAGMGLCSLVMTVGGFAATVSTAGVGFAITRLHPALTAKGETRGARETVGAALSLALLLGGFSCALLLLLADVIGGRLLGSPSVIPAIRILALSLPFMAVSGALSGYFIATRRSRVGAVVRVAEQLLRFAFLPLLLGLLCDRGLSYACIAVVLGWALSEGVSCLFFAICFLRHRHDLAKPTRAAFTAVSATAIPILLSSLIRSGLTTVEHLLIPRALRASGSAVGEALASYGILAGMALPITLLPMAFVSSAAGLLVVECAERHATHGRNAVAALASRALCATLAIGIGCCTLLLLLADFLGTRFGAGHELRDYLLLLAPVLPLMLLDHVTDAILRGIGEQVYSMWVNIADSLLSILLVMTLLPLLGARGYTTVILLAEIFNLSLSLGRLIYVTGVRMDLGKSLLPPLAGALAALALSLPLGRVGQLPTLALAVGAVSTVYAIRQAARTDGEISSPDPSPS